MRGTLILAPLLLSLVGIPLGAQQPVVIDGATIVSPHLTEPLTDCSIVVVEGRIQALGRIEELAIPSQAQRIDGRGKWVIPGLIEVHTHSGAADALSRALALGVTTAQMIGGPADPSQVEEQSNLADVPSPRLTLLTGRFGEFVGASTPATVDVAESEVRDMRSDGVRAIKIWQDDGTLWFPLDQTFPAIPEDAFRALVRTAHEHGMEVAVHAWRLPFFELAIDAGADRLIHPVADVRVPDSIWDGMRENDLAWTTTMTVLLTYADIPEYARRVLADQRLVSALSKAAREQLEINLSGTDFSRYERYSVMRANRDVYMRTVRENTLNARANGVSIVVGSDATIGVGTHIEMELMADAGLSPLEILTAATINGARALGLDDRIGTIEVGKIADLVVLNASPLADVTNLRDTFLVLKGGHVFDRATLTAGAAP